MNTMPIECDCLNHCGDDHRLSSGKVRPCQTLIDFQRQRDIAKKQLEARLVLHSRFNTSKIEELVVAMAAHIAQLETPDVNDTPPTLDNDSFVDKAIAAMSIALWDSPTGGVTNAVQILVRPTDVRSDESGAHPGESFVMLTVVREEIREMLRALNDDWADQLKFAKGLPA